MILEAQTGLLYFVSGVLAFTLLLVALRELGMYFDSKSLSPSGSVTDWFGTDTLKIVGIRKETPDIKTFRLQRKNGGVFPHFEEGQFLSFQIGPVEDKVLRSYSISSSTFNRKTLDVSIKLLKDGVGSGWFHARKLGDEVVAHSPSGLFTLGSLKESQSPLVFVAGGIGITPFLSMLKTLQDGANTGPVYLFYGARSLADLAFHKTLSLLETRNDWFQYIPVISGEDSGWSGQTGFINHGLIADTIGDFKAAKYFFCGPPILTESVCKGLTESGVSEEAFHSEKFASPASMDLDKIEPRQATVQIDGKSLAYDGKQSLLEFFEDQGVAMAYACRSGVCGACKCRLVSGEVDAFSDSGLTKEEIRSGFIQTCVSRPTSNIELSRG